MPSEVKLSEAQWSYYCRVAKLSVSVPKVKEAIDAGEFSLSKARRIEPVVTNENVDEWIGKAAALKQNELEREVAKVNPRAATRETIKPVAENRSEWKLGITDEFERKLRRLCGVLGKSIEDSLEDAVTVLLEKKDAEKKAERAVAKNLPRKAQVPTPGKRQPIPAFSKHTTYLDQGVRCSHSDKAASVAKISAT